MVERWVVNPSTHEELRLILHIDNRKPRLAVANGNYYRYMETIIGLSSDFPTIVDKINKKTMEQFEELKNSAIDQVDLQNNTIKFNAVRLVYIKRNNQINRMNVNSTDTISKIKGNECSEHPTYALHRDQLLVDNETLQVKQIESGSLICLGYKIYIYPPEDFFSLDVSCESSIGELKKRIELITKIPISDQRLSCNSKELNDDSETLHKYEIRENSNLRLNASLKGGGPKTHPFLNLNIQDSPNPNDVVKFDSALSLLGEPWHKVTRGLNLKGICENEKCDAFDKKVWINLGLQPFTQGSLLRGFKCPCCDGNIEKIINVGFYNCKYTIEGAFKNKQRTSGSIDIKDQKTAYNKLRVLFEDANKEEYLDYQFISITLLKRPLTFWQRFRWT